MAPLASRLAGFFCEAFDVWRVLSALAGNFATQVELIDWRPSGWETCPVRLKTSLDAILRATAPRTVRAYEWMILTLRGLRKSIGKSGLIDGLNMEIEIVIALVLAGAVILILFAAFRGDGDPPWRD